jgi:diacylglycerol kinase family enzyme
MESEVRVQRLPRLRRRHVVVVANANASGVRPEFVGAVEAELARWGASGPTLVTESPEEWVEDLESAGERRVVLVGGDGTLHAAAGLSWVKPELALIPAGSANNVAHSLGIPLARGAAAKLAVEGRSKPIDLIEAVTPSCRHVTVEGISAGFLSLARSHYHEANSSHAAAALAAGARALAGFHPLRVRVMRGAAAEELMLAQLFVANLPLYGFGLHVATGVDVTDDLLDVVAIEGRGRPELLSMVARLHHGTELERAEARRWRAAHVRIDTHGAVPVVADSFDLGPGPVELSVLPRELPLVRP